MSPVPCSIWVVLKFRSLFSVPIVVRHPYEKDPKRDSKKVGYYPFEKRGCAVRFVTGFPYGSMRGSP